MAGLLDLITGGDSSNATDAEKQALAALQGVATPTAQALTLPQLQQYAVAMGMTPAQMQAFLQQNNAFNTENIGQQGTAAQQQALSQLANVANAGAQGTPVEQAQIAQALQQSNQNLAGQRGAIDQAAQARGVPLGLLQAALSQQNAGQDAQNANQAALQAQSQAYQTALNAMTGQANVGQALQGQQNTQANTIAQAQNAMQQFNAANQQNAAAQNAGYQQQANQYNTGMANQVGQQNTGLANQRTMYNAQVPETVFNNQMQKATGVANQNNQLANMYQQQGQQQAGLLSGLVGAGATALNPAMGTAMQATGYGNGPPASANTEQYRPASTAMPYAYGGAVTQDIPMAQGGIAHNPDDLMKAMALMRSGKYTSPPSTPVPGPNAIPEIYKGADGRQHASYSQMACEGGMSMKRGGSVPGQAKVPGDSEVNDTVHAKLSPGEFVVPRSVVQSHPEDIATLLQAMQHLRGKSNAPQAR